VLFQRGKIIGLPVDPPEAEAYLIWLGCLAGI